MKKSKLVVLGAVFTAAVASCSNQPTWIKGDTNGRTRDSAYNGHVYRNYNGGWYPVYHGYICPGYYGRPYTAGEVSSPGFTPAAISSGVVAHAGSGVSTGGFGSSAHSSGAAGE